jgi:hypothetical protein
MMMRKTNEQRGMVLIVALIMLALITFLVIAFLSFTRLDRSAVTMSVRQTETHLAIDAGLARAQSAVVDEIVSNRNYQVLVSTNIDGAAFTTPIPKAELTLLQADPRAPVYYDLNGDRKPDEFRYFLNLNHDLGPNERAAFQPTTTNQVGDPHWIGVLEDPSRPHGKDNRFVARYAYMVTSGDKLLDLNHAHNNAKTLGNEEGYLRGHGNAAWELNVAGSLAMLDPVAFSYSGYRQQPDQSSLGEAFRHAGGRHINQPRFVGLWNYRYPWGNMDTVQPGMPNQREHVDIMNFLRPPYRPAVKGMQPITHEGVTTWLQTDKTGRAFYNLAGAFSTLTAEAPATSKSIDAMGIRLGQPPKVKLLLNEYFSDKDFTELPNQWPWMRADRVGIDNVPGKAIAEVLEFDARHGLSTGQRVLLTARAQSTTNVMNQTVYRYFSATNRVPVSVAGQWFFAQALDSRRVRLWDIPLRRGGADPTDDHKVKFMIVGRNKQGVAVPSDFSNLPAPVNFQLRFDPLAKKFTRLASLLLDNAMQRQGDAFHIGSDPTLTLFNNEADASTFGADNIQVYPPANNNFTPEVQRLLQVALNLTEVYAPDTAYTLPNNGGVMRLAWPRVFRPILLREAGDNVYIAGWMRVMNDFQLEQFPVRDLPDALQPNVAWNPHDRLGQVPDRPGVPQVPGNRITGFPLLIGVNRRTQTPNHSAIWPSVNEVSAAIKWHLTEDPNPSRVLVKPVLHVGVELRDNLYSHALALEATVAGSVTGQLEGAGPARAISAYLSRTTPFSLQTGKTAFPVMHFQFPLSPISLSATNRTPWRVDNLRVNLAIKITCRDPNAAQSRVIDYARLHFAANLPAQWERWQSDQNYKQGEQVEDARGNRYYARTAHTSFDFGADFTRWKQAAWKPGETFQPNEVIRCVNNGINRTSLFRCLQKHTTPNGGIFLPSLKQNGNLLWEIYRGETYEMSWQVNDPLVNGVGRSYTMVHPAEPNNAHPSQPPYIKFLTGTAGNWNSNNLGFENYVYRPWSISDTRYNTQKNLTRPWADSYDHTTLKDPGIIDSNSWIFPHKDTGGLESLGWLGMVHRGTPWQSIYLKSKPANRLIIHSINAVTGVITAGEVPFFWQGDRVQLQGGPPDYQGYDGNIRYDYSNPQLAPKTLTLWDATFTINKLATTVGYTHDPADPSSWMYLISTDAWQRQTGTLDTLPTNDHRLVDLFSTSASPVAATGLLSVNAKSPAAWGAVLSGVAVPRKVLKNNGGMWAFHNARHFGNCMDPACMGYDFRLAPGAFMHRIVRSIDRHRGEIPFERVSDILKVSELTDGNPDFLSMINDAQLNTGNMTQLYAQRFFPNEIDYERIPQQILSLLRTDGTPRFVACTFSQTLKPAQNAVEKDGLCTNYAITSEAAQRTVFRLEGVEKWREYHFKIKHGVPGPNMPALPRMVIESTSPLILR